MTRGLSLFPSGKCLPTTGDGGGCYDHRPVVNTLDTLYCIEKGDGDLHRWIVGVTWHHDNRWMQISDRNTKMVIFDFQLEILNPSEFS